MKPYGRRAPVRRTAAGHQDCGTCQPNDVVKARERRKPILIEPQEDPVRKLIFRYEPEAKDYPDHMIENLLLRYDELTQTKKANDNLAIKFSSLAWIQCLMTLLAEKKLRCEVEVWWDETTKTEWQDKHAIDIPNQVWSIREGWHARYAAVFPETE